MTTPTVTETPLSLEPVTADPFAGPDAATTVVETLRHVLNYVECDLAPDTTLPQRRAARADAIRRRGRLRSVLHPGRRQPALAA